MMREDLYFVGITCIFGYAGNNKMGWQATLKWQDSKFAQSGAVEGEIKTRYFEPSLTQAIEEVMEVAEQWQLKTIPNLTPSLLYSEDGENLDYPPPENWKETLQAVADKYRWGSYLDWKISEGDKED